MVPTTSIWGVIVLIGERSKPFDVEITIASVSSWSATATAVIDLEVFQVLIRQELLIVVPMRGIFPFKFHRALFKTEKILIHTEIIIK